MAKCVLGSFLFVVLLFCCPFCSIPPLPLTALSKKLYSKSTPHQSLLRDDTTHFIRRETMSNDGSTNASLFFVAGSCVGMLVRRSSFFSCLNHNENNKRSFVLVLSLFVITVFTDITTYSSSSSSSFYKRSGSGCGSICVLLRQCDQRFGR